VLHAVSLGAVLYCLWLLLSGYFQALLLSLGGVSVIAVVWIAHRMDVIDHEGHPIHLTARAILYWPWLIGEIVKANIDIARVIVRGKMPISPSVIEVKATQGTELGQVIFANSITLTPGTVTIAVDRDIVSVHALTRESADGLLTGDMDRRVTAMEAHEDPYRRRGTTDPGGGAR
jgi:multicomponent Na+:H+ antiporter subunit E